MLGPPNPRRLDAPVAVSLVALVPMENFYRHLQAKLDLSFVRCRLFENAAFDRHARMAQETAGWRYVELVTPHLPYITHPADLAEILLELAA